MKISVYQRSEFSTSCSYAEHRNEKIQSLTVVMPAVVIVVMVMIMAVVMPVIMVVVV